MRKLLNTLKGRQATITLITIVFIAVLAIIAAIFKVGRGGRYEISTNMLDFEPYIAAYTSGGISRNATIQVVFAQTPKKNAAPGESAPRSLMNISPSVKGDLTWTNPRTLEFVPKEGFESGKEYRISIAVGKLFDNTPEPASRFTFSVIVLKQSIALLSADYYINSSDATAGSVRGELRTADAASAELLARAISVVADGATSLKVHVATGETPNSFHFVSEPLPAGCKTAAVRCAAQDKSIAGFHDTQVRLPQSNRFEVLHWYAIEHPAQAMRIVFSKPLDKTQNLAGLIYGEGIIDPRLKIDGNLLTVFPSNNLKGDFTFLLEQSIQAENGAQLQQNTRCDVSFSGRDPNLAFVKNGYIIPALGQVQIPIRTVGLRAVDVSVYKIFQSNLLYSFQNDNSFNYGGDLQRVGKLLFRKTIPLNESDKGENAVYTLDLTSLIKAEPGAMYRIGLSMRKELANSCSEPLSNVMLHPDNYAQWGYASDYQNYNYDYDWNDRNDPATDSYYRYRGFTWRNLLVSNIGIIAKRDGANRIYCYTTNLTLGAPLAAVNVTLYSYQLQELASATTNSDGLAIFNYADGDAPFLLVAEQGGSRSYLNVRDATDQLSYSTFDTQGVELQKGLQGFFYGDRDVWRPGDSIFMTLMLEDRLARLPKQHPVEFSLRSPRGQVVDRRVFQGNSSKMYTFRTATTPDAETGHYSIDARIGGSTFHKNIRIETIKPNRLKVNLELKEDMLRAGAYTAAELSSTWLHGAKAARLNASVDAIFTTQEVPFASYEHYVFTDEGSQRTNIEVNLFSNTLDAEGKASFSVQVPQLKTNSRVNTLLRSKVYEPGGGYTLHISNTTYSPFPRYVGVLAPKRNAYYLETDTPQTFKVVTLNADGKPLPNVPLKASLYKIQWAWWWEHDNESLANYLSSGHAEQVGSPINLTTDDNGLGQFSIRIDYPSYGRYLIRVTDETGGHASAQVVYFDWPDSYERDASRYGDDAKVLSFECDKPQYEVGERATLSIPSTQGGRLLVSIENAEGILHSVWAEAKTGTTKVSFEITEEMAPNAYANVMLIQPYGQSTNDLPLRMYGAIPITVENNGSHLAPVIKLPESVRPESQFTAEVYEQNGAPMCFTLAVVDEGLLNITNFTTPSPWSYFHRKRALGVATYDFYDNIMGGYAGRITGVLNVGGDEYSEQGNATPRASRFKPVVRFYGPYELQRKENKKIKVSMPNYVGSVRVMVVAKNDKAYGSTDATLPVRSPLMVQPTLPRVLGINEKVNLPVAIFAMDDKIHDVTVKLQTNDLLTASSVRQTLSFTEQGDKIIAFPVQTSSKTGIAKVKITATAGGEEASAEVSIDVRNPNPRVTYMNSTLVKKGNTGNIAYTPIANDAEASGTVEISRFPTVNYTRLLEYAEHYPFNGLEQQTSLAIARMLYPELVASDNASRQELAAKVQAFIGSLARYQTSRGGFAQWLGFSREDDWTTNYVGHFLIEARRRGFNVPNALLARWKLFQQQAANAWSSERANDDPALQQAYRLYTLARAGHAQLGAMNRLRSVSNLPLQAERRLAAAYLAAGNAKIAKNMFSKPEPAAPSASHYASNLCYGSELRNRAMLLEELSEFGELSKALTTLESIAAALTSDFWISSQELGFVMLATAKFSKAANANADDIYGTLEIDGRKQSIKGNAPSYTVRFAPRQNAPGVISFTNKSNGSAFITASNSGTPAGAHVLAAAKNLSIGVQYLALDGSILSPYSIPQGTDFKIVVTVTNPGYKGELNQLALDLPIPSGWELQPASIEGALPNRQSSFYYQDQRDDGVTTYFGLAPNQSKQFTFNVSASYAGTFSLPSIACRALYLRDVSANTEGGTVTVTAR